MLFRCIIYFFGSGYDLLENFSQHVDELLRRIKCQEILISGINPSFRTMNLLLGNDKSIIDSKHVSVSLFLYYCQNLVRCRTYLDTNFPFRKVPTILCFC